MERQIPAVASDRAQSHPKLQAIFRMKLNGSGVFIHGSVPSFSSQWRAYFTAEAKVIVSSLARDGAHPRVEPIPHVHVFRTSDHLAVEVNRRQGIEAIAGEVDPLLLEQRWVSVEGATVLPFGQADPVEPSLVRLQIRIDDQASRKQVRMHASRNCRRDRMVPHRWHNRRFAARLHRPPQVFQKGS